MVRSRLASNRKMESEEGACRVSFGGAVVSPRTKPISPRGVITSPESDCNSNNLTLPSDNPLYCSNDSTQDGPDFIQDNSDYQWFLDYGYRENTNHHQSILSLSTSHELGYYDDMARNLDANLAEVDMDDFHREDIHSILSTLPNMCCNDMQGVEEREMFASVSGSMMVKFDFDSSISPHTSSQEENINSMSVCKSELLFSPVRESYLPVANLSVDSLDLSENDINIMVTCQANKNNYTIAFEGSTIMGSDDSECPETGESGETTSEENLLTHYRNEQQQKGDQQILRHIDNSMARSDSMYTTWSKLKQRSSEHLQLRRHPSGNNNTTQTDAATEDSNNINNSNTGKSLSLPNLFRQKQRNMLGLSVSSKLSSEMGSSLENDQHCIKLYDIQKSNTSDSSADRSSSSAAGKPQDRPHNFSLVKLFIKQKSASHEGMSNYSMDQSSASECWDGSNTTSDDKGNERVTNFKQDCSCHNLNKSKGIQVLKNNWTGGDKRHNPNCSLSCFEDSLVSKKQNKNEKIQEKEISDSESVEQISESSKQISESVEQITESCNDSTHITSNAFDESSHNKIKNINYAFNVNNNNSYLGSNNKKSKYSSDESTQENGSNTESAENIPCNCKKSQEIRRSVMEKSIQTSKVIENESAEKKQLKVPVYILYPNYSLPNLEFLKEKHYVQNIDFSKIFLRPQKFESPQSPMSGNKKIKTSGKRPFSVNDIESLKKTGFKHVRDWDSLTFLLPREYKQFLQEIPEIVAQLKDIKNAKDDLKPLFCLSPPPTRHVKKRPTSCDSNFFSADCRSSNFSSTATQPSSGYRGSSTMLNSNNSNATPSPKNPSFGYNYSISESNSSRKSTAKSPLNSSSDDTTTRPPLPRSILRNSSLDNPKYTCKTQKENANKRYSMIELSEKNSEDKLIKRKSIQDPYYLNSPQKNVRAKKLPKNKNLENYEFPDNDENAQMHKPNIENDMRRLEELLEISMVFGESMESFTENDMSKLRNQVSKFLTMQKNLEKVSETLQNVNDKKISETYNVDKDGDMFEGKRLLDVKYSQTPNNTPEHRKKPPLAACEGCDSDIDNSTCVDCGFYGDGCSCARMMPCSDCGVDGCNCKEDSFKGLKKTVSFAEKISFLMKEQEMKFKGLTPPNSPNISSLLGNQKSYQCKSKRLVDVPICEESFEGSPGGSPSKNVLQPTAHLLYKRDLVMDVRKAVEKIIAHSRSDYDNKQEGLANLCLHHLCPSLYAILSDGLKEQITTQFGPIRNSVWTVVEASSQQGPMTQTLNELVQRLNRDDVLSEGLVKFNAFVFGLLNVHALDAWFSYLRTRDGLLRKYYDNSGLLVLSNSAGAPVRVLMDQLIEIIEPLSSIQFNLDLLYQAKLLHSSLLNLNTLLEATNNDLLSPNKHIMLLKLVQSIQNSITNSSDGKKGKSTSEDIESLTSDPPVTQLLEKSVNSRGGHGNSKPRPRSGCDIGQESDVASTVNKRWSTVQFNSKLLQAFERLGEETESDYTDSLENPRLKREREKELSSPSKNIPKRLQSSDDTSDDISHTWTKDSVSSENKTKEQKKNILSNLNKKTAGRLEDFKTDVNEKEIGLDQSITQMKSGGHKFKRLQQRWELLSGKSASDSSGSNTPSQVVSPSHTRSKIPTSKPEKSHCDTNITTPSPTSKVSKIPRLVTSPVPFTPPSARQIGTSKKLVSPTSTNQSIPYRGTKVNYGNTSKVHSNEPNGKNTGTNRLSRCDDKSEPIGVGRSHAVRPTSLPYRNTNTMPAKKSVQITPRASSASVNRRPVASKLQQNAQRTVRTLTHRLPSDSGHLSFNEGEKLKVVLEVDETWLLCCRGTQKGLVPKSAVITVPDHTRF